VGWEPEEETQMTKAKIAVTLGADVGGKDADAATDEHCMSLRKALERHCRGSYSPVLEKFAIVLRIDGSVQAWKKSGVDFTRVQKSAGYATADIFLPVEVWKDAPALAICRFLGEQCIAAIRSMVERATKVKVPVDGEKLLADVNRAVEEFLESCR
jgi:hypothetical protein